MIKVSVVVPIYNVSRYLRECLDSLINQTLKEIEIICVNDGSTDSSLEIIKEYALKDRRVRCIDKKNEGYGKSVNRGIDEASGVYIGIVEPDDFVSLQMYEELYELAEENNLEVVKGDFAEFSGDEINRNIIKRKIILKDELYFKVVRPRDVNEFFRGYLMNPSGIYKRDFLREKDIRHNETPGAAYQDQGFWFQIMKNANRFFLTDTCVYYYRQDNPNSSISSVEKVYCICDEYEFIRNKLQGELQGQFFCCMVNNYLGTYKRISEKYKLDFLKRFRDDIKYLTEKNMLDESFLNEEEKRIYLEIMNDYKEFHNQYIAFPRYIHSHVEKHDKVIIYGAGGYGRRVFQAISLEDRRKIVAFAVSNMCDNMNSLFGIEVKDIREFCNIRSSVAVIVAVSKRYQNEILTLLKELQFENIVYVPEGMI